MSSFATSPGHVEPSAPELLDPVTPSVALSDVGVGLTRRKLGLNTLLYGAGALLSRLASFLMLPIYTRHFTPRDYGLLQMLDLSVELTAHLMSIGLGAAVMRSYFRTNDETERSRILSSGWMLILLAHASGMVVLLIAAPFISRGLIGDAGSVALVRLAAVSFFAGALPIIPLVLMQTQQRAGLYVAATGLKLGVQLALNVLFIVVLSWGPRGVVASTLLSNVAIGIPVSAWMLWRSGFRISRAVWRELLRFAVPLQVGSVAMLIMALGDRWFLETSYGLAAVGIYSLAYQFGFLVTGLSAPFVQAWNPQRFQFVALAPSDRDARYNEGFHYFNLILSVLAVGIGLFCRPLLRVVAGSAFWSAADYVPILVMAYMVQAWTNTVHFGIDVSGEAKYSSYANWIAAAAILILYALLIPPFGAWGAAIATLVGFLVRFVFVYGWAQRLWPVRYEWGPVARLTILSVVVLACSVPLRWVGLAAQIGISVALMLAFIGVIWVFDVSAPMKRQLARVLADGRNSMRSPRVSR